MPDVMLLIADLLIAVAYFSIPVQLGRFVIRLMDYDGRLRIVCFMFILFIALCGCTHLVAAIDMYVYVAEGVVVGVKMATALISLATAGYILRIEAGLMGLLNWYRELPDNNRRLQDEIECRQIAEHRVHQQNDQLKALRRISDKIRSVLDIREVLNCSADELMKNFAISQLWILEEFSDQRIEVSVEKCKPSVDTVMKLKPELEVCDLKKIVQTSKMHLRSAETRSITVLNFEVMKTCFLSDEISFNRHSTEEDSVIIQTSLLDTGSSCSSDSDDTWIIRTLNVHNGHSLSVLFRMENYDKEVTRLDLLEDVLLQIEIAIKQANAIASEKALIHERAKTEAEHEAKSSFLANISHELRTPLHAVIGLSGILKDPDPDLDTNQQFELANSIHQSANHLLLLINDLLDYSKYENQSFSLNFKPFCLVDSIESAMQMAWSRLLEMKKTVHLNYHINLDVPLYLIGDELRLTQVLINLLSNSTKFTSQGMITLTVSLIHVKDCTYQDCKESGLTDTPAPVAELEFIVEDTGCGIPQEVLPKLFERFVQAHDSSASRHPGTGLGLAIVRTLVSKMNGSVRIESEGSGTRVMFKVQLPIAPENPSFRKVFPTSRLLKLNQLVSGPRGVVLICSNQIDVFACRNHFKRYGIGTVDFSSIKQALDALTNSSLSTEEFQKNFLVIVDSLLISKDGTDFGELKRLCQEFNVSILLWSDREVSKVKQLLGEDANSIKHWVSRPIRLTQVAHMVDSIRKLTGVEEMKNTAQTSSLRESRSSEEGGNVQNLCIAVVDDNPVNLKVTERMLSRLGCKSTLFNSGTEILEYFDDLEQHPNFNLILLDLHMPGLDGVETFEELKKKHSIEMPVYALTASVSDKELRRCIDAGMTGIIPKPISLEEMRSKLEEVQQ